jgi:S1-C subfamily serine protease
MISRAGLLLVLAQCFGASGAAELPEVVAVVKPSVVGVGTMLYSRRPAGEFLGTGFTVQDGRHVITNAHVVVRPLDGAGASSEFLAIFAGSGSKVEARRAMVVALDREHDLALLKFEGQPLPPLTLALNEQVREGQLLAFTGFPLGTLLGMYPATHRGIVASITPLALPAHPGIQGARSNLDAVSRYEVYQLDATAYPGNSGSPLYLPRQGSVVGVINKVFIRGDREDAAERPSGITYAIPVEYVRKLLEAAGFEP